jgi:hypothetical protein
MNLSMIIPTPPKQILFYKNSGGIGKRVVEWVMHEWPWMNSGGRPLCSFAQRKCSEMYLNTNRNHSQQKPLQRSEATSHAHPPIPQQKHSASSSCRPIHASISSMWLWLQSLVFVIEMLGFSWCHIHENEALYLIRGSSDSLHYAVRSETQV